MVDDQIALLLIMKIRFSTAENISFYLELGKIFDLSQLPIFFTT